MIYLFAAMALAVAVAGGWGKWEQHRAETAEAKVEARDATIRQQNDAIAATKADGERRVSEATKGAARAAQGTQAARTEAGRLKGLLAAAAPAGACPAGAGVAKVREGLR